MVRMFSALDTPASSPLANYLVSMLNMTLKNRFKIAMDRIGINQSELGRRAKVSRGTVSLWLNGTTKELHGKNLLNAANALQVNPEWLSTGRGQMIENSELNPNTSPADLKKGVPLISWVQAGDWQEAIDNFHTGDGEGMIPTTKNVGDSAYALRVDGDSMEPEFMDGSIIVVDPDAEVINKCYVIAKLNGQDVTFKQYMEDGARRYLKPMNTAYPIIDITNLEVEFCGRIVQQLKEY